jgi:hypothetical protein
MRMTGMSRKANEAVSRVDFAVAFAPVARVLGFFATRVSLKFFGAWILPDLGTISPGAPAVDWREEVAYRSVCAVDRRSAMPAHAARGSDAVANVISR